jgi:TonB-linked SusC/RagA family outer membrane protein
MCNHHRRLFKAGVSICVRTPTSTFLHASYKNLNQVMNKIESIQQRFVLFLKISLIQALLLIVTASLATAGNKTDDLYLIAVSGKVTDDQGVSLPGVNVLVKGTAVGTTTDANGDYTLNVEDGSGTLVFSFIGYDTKEIPIANQTRIDVQLDTDITTLGEVVVVGYATRAKGAVTGAIATVKSDVFENRPLNNSLDALQGTLPGVTITRASGQPGDQSKYALQIRGYSSINGNQPLVLIDGVPGDLNLINPNDITQLSVLKDAAAAIYGSRAADGVIIVTTKNGKTGAPVIEYSGNFGIKTPTYLRQIQNTLQFAEFMDEGLRNAGIAGYSPSVFDKIRAGAEPDPTGWHLGVTGYPGFYGYTDWNKEIYKSSTQQLHNISVSGGGENNSYMVSLGYNHDD